MAAYVKTEPPDDTGALDPVADVVNQAQQSDYDWPNIHHDVSNVKIEPQYDLDMAGTSETRHSVLEDHIVKCEAEDDGETGFSHNDTACSGTGVNIIESGIKLEDMDGNFVAESGNQQGYMLDTDDDPTVIDSMRPVTSLQNMLDNIPPDSELLGMVMPKSPSTFTCEQCDLKFSSKSNLSRHIKATHNKKPVEYKCFVCNCSYQHSYQLEKHYKSSSCEKPFQCDECNKKFTTKLSLYYHKRIHTGIKPFTCFICQATFYKSSVLNAHIRRHNGEKKIPCTLCDKKFYVESKLIIHMRNHSGEKPYNCDTCGAAFTSSSTLNKHVKIHDTKQYKCPKCDYVTNSEYYLKYHDLKHAEDKGFKCDTCGLDFPRAQNLRKHMATHEGNIKFTCEECNIGFTDHRPYYKHVRQFHKK